MTKPPRTRKFKRWGKPTKSSGNIQGSLYLRFPSVVPTHSRGQGRTFKGYKHQFLTLCLNPLHGERMSRSQQEKARFTSGNKKAEWGNSGWGNSSPNEQSNRAPPNSPGHEPPGRWLWEQTLLGREPMPHTYSRNRQETSQKFRAHWY